MRKKFNIKAVSKMTGLNVHTIRAWERRYYAITPERTETNRRLYTKEEIEKLTLLAQAVQSGHTISSIANYNIKNLRDLVHKNGYTESSKDVNIESSFLEYTEQSLKFIKEFNREGFEKILMQASVNFNKQKILTGFIIPLLIEIGELWAKGDLRIMHEHFASSVIRTYLGSLIGGTLNYKDAPKIITTTPEGFMHEFGALIAAIYSAQFGWNSIFLGRSLPAEEISAAVIENKASAVLLSLIYPRAEPGAEIHLRKLRRYLGDDFPIIISGQAAPSYKNVSDEIKSHLILKLTDLNSVLEKIKM